MTGASHSAAFPGPEDFHISEHCFTTKQVKLENTAIGLYIPNKIR